jgi:flagellar hook protein FlgE
MRKTAMFSPLSAAGNGLSQAVSRATQSAGNVANASLTGKNIDGDMVNLAAAKTDFAANASAIKTEEKMQKALLDIKV